jgi:diacylglycerol kinase family enzyme
MRRAAAVAAIAALVLAVALLVALGTANARDLLVAAPGLVLLVVGAWYALARRGSMRLVALLLVAVGLAAVIWSALAGGPAPWRWSGVAASSATSVAAAGYALRRRDRRVHEAVRAPTPRHPVLFVNPKSGEGKAEALDLDGECRARGIEPIVIGPDDDLRKMAEDAVARGADVLGMAGGDGSQAIVGSVASEHGIPHVVVPAGTRNHFALDLGLDRDDVVGALDAFTDGVERTIDLAEVNGRPFVNNASMGVYAKIVRSPEYRDAKVRTTIEMLPDLVGPDAEAMDLRFTGPDGEEVPTAEVLQVSNDPYALQHASGRGSRPRIDLGVLGVVAVNLRTADDVQRFLSLQAVGQLDRFEGWREWTTDRFEVRSGGPVDVGVDGEALTMDPPVVFTSKPGALRVRLPAHAPGMSPAAEAALLTDRSPIVTLACIAAGRPESA